MDALSVPRAEPLSGNVMLPFTLWRVADLVDGRRSVGGIAGALNAPVAGVLGALEAVERELGVALTEAAAAPSAALPTADARPTLGGAALQDALVTVMVDLMGPMGEVIVEDAVDDVGEDAPSAELIARIAQDLREPQRGAFLGRLRAKGLT